MARLSFTEVEKYLQEHDDMTLAEFARLLGRMSTQKLNGWKKRGQVSADESDRVAKFIYAERISLQEPGAPDYVSNAFAGPSKPRPLRRIPIVGRARGGDNGFMEEEQYSVGHGNGWLEVPTKDQNSFGLRIEGDSMDPVFPHGSYAAVEPNEMYEVGDDVYVALHDGRKLIKRLAWDRKDSVRLDSYNQHHASITIDRVEIAAIYPVTPVRRRHFIPGT